MVPYEVVPYSAGTLGDLLVRKSHDHRNEGVRQKPHIPYLDEYFQEVGAKAIILEHAYIDRDFIEDFSAYHVRCFTDYRRICSRLHFFSEPVTADQFDLILRHQESAETLQKSYLGFMVVKPLPSTIIGRTCLVTYPAQAAGRTRHFPTTRKVRVNLFRIDLEVDSLPFQEQDRDVAACASSALWSVLNGTGHLFHHEIPSPVEITKAAALHMRVDDRNLPAGNGLNAFQIADAIRSVGLEPQPFKSSDPFDLKLAASAYLRAGIPSMLLAMIVQKPASGGRRLIGNHAMAITGFSYPNPPCITPTPTGSLFRASSIDRLYCHDDQVGPFARLAFDPAGTVAVSWSDGPGTLGSYFAEPVNLIVSLYHKIRIPFSAVFKTSQFLDKLLEESRVANLLPLSERIVWDLYLTDVNPFRRELFNSNVDERNRMRLLQRNYPKYLWRLEAKSGLDALFDVLFDATDLLQGQHLVDIVPRRLAICRSISVLAQMMGQTDRLLMRHELRHVLQWFADQEELLQ
jgi:hypothetical protein